MKQTWTLIAVLFFVFMIGGLFLWKDNNISLTGATSAESAIQRITLSEKANNYYPHQIQVKAGQPVSISLDSSVVGCLRSFTIKELGVAKLAATPQDTIDFTPTQKGTYKFACSMGMGSGTLIVD